jgi:hypothetical protein
MYALQGLQMTCMDFQTKSSYCRPSVFVAHSGRKYFKRKSLSGLVIFHTVNKNFFYFTNFCVTDAALPDFLSPGWMQLDSLLGSAVRLHNSHSFISLTKTLV